MQITDTTLDKDPRFGALRAWLATLDLGAGELRRASDDASFRRYFRYSTGTESFIAMDAPPEQENSQPFVKVAEDLKAMKLNAPRVIASDLQQGFLLLSDLGDAPYLDVLQAHPERAEELYGDAIFALRMMQNRGAARQASLPPYDEKLLRFELSLFSDWLCGTHLGLEWDDEDQRQWSAVCEILVRNALDQPRVYVHRDYHSRNLMVVDEANPGILDFQDAVEGPLTYDLVSLLKDCYIRWPAARVHRWAKRFYDELDDGVRQSIDMELFLRHFELMGVQRHIKAAGIFCRLNHRDGKARYLDDIPQTLQYILEVAGRYKELGWLGELIAARILPVWGR